MQKYVRTASRRSVQRGFSGGRSRCEEHQDQTGWSTHFSITNTPYCRGNGLGMLLTLGLTCNDSSSCCSVDNKAGNECMG